MFLHTCFWAKTTLVASAPQWLRLLHHCMPHTQRGVWKQYSIILALWKHKWRRSRAGNRPSHSAHKSETLGPFFSHEAENFTDAEFGSKPRTAQYLQTFLWPGSSRSAPGITHEPQEYDTCKNWAVFSDSTSTPCMDKKTSSSVSGRKPKDTGMQCWDTWNQLLSRVVNPLLTRFCLLQYDLASSCVGTWVGVWVPSWPPSAWWKCRTQLNLWLPRIKSLCFLTIQDNWWTVSQNWAFLFACLFVYCHWNQGNSKISRSHC